MRLSRPLNEPHCPFTLMLIQNPAHSPKRHRLINDGNFNEGKDEDEALDRQWSWLNGVISSCAPYPIQVVFVVAKAFVKINC